MQKNNYSTIIDFGSSELRLGVFDNQFSQLFFQSKSISQKNNYEEYSQSINFLIREAENKVSNHLENITVLYDTSDVYTIDLTIKKKLDQKINIDDVCSSIILEGNQLIKSFYSNKKIIHFLIKKYIINGKEFLKVPDKIFELNSLILEIKFICLPYDQYNNIFEIFKKNNLKILNFFSSSLVKTFQYIEYFKKSNYVAFLDIGLDRTTLILFKNQKLEYMNSIPIGGNSISKDISQMLKLTLEEAEEIKKAFNKSEIDFSYNESVLTENSINFKKIIEKNISIDLLKKVVLARLEEIIKLSFKNVNISNNAHKQQNLNLVLIGKGSKILNRNSFQIEDRYNFKEINFYEENDIEICKAGFTFERKFQNPNSSGLKKNQKKLGFFHRFFNIFGNG